MADQSSKVNRISMSPLCQPNGSILKKLAFNINNGGSTSIRTFNLLTQPLQNRSTMDVESKYQDCYEEICKIGQGNFAMVFKCKNKVDDQIYAIKRTKAQLKSLIEKSDARQEACILAKLFSQNDMKNLVQYFHSWIEQNQLYLVMEYCDYNIKHQLAYQEWEIKQMMKDVLNGLSFLHSQGYVHMDLKPDNILFKKSQVAYKIADFGLARLSFLKEGEDIRDGDTRYLAPELMEYVNFNIPIELQKVDIFAFGCTLYEIMNQIQLPKQDDEYNRLRKGITIEDFGDVGIKYTDELKTIICKMMSPKPELRPTAQEILNSSYLVVPKVNYGKFLEFSNMLKLQQQRRRRMEVNKKRRNSLGGKVQQEKYQEFVNEIVCLVSRNSGKNRGMEEEGFECNQKNQMNFPVSFKGINLIRSEKVVNISRKYSI